MARVRGLGAGGGTVGLIAGGVITFIFAGTLYMQQVLHYSALQTRRGIIWAAQVPVHGHFLANLAGPFVVAGAGTAFSFIPISVAALEGVSEHQSGLASGLLTRPRSLAPRSGRQSRPASRRAGPRRCSERGTPCRRR